MGPGYIDLHHPSITSTVYAMHKVLRIMLTFVLLDIIFIIQSRPIVDRSKQTHTGVSQAQSNPSADLPSAVAIPRAT